MKIIKYFLIIILIIFLSEESKSQTKVIPKQLIGTWEYTNGRNVFEIKSNEVLLHRLDLNPDGSITFQLPFKISSKSLIIENRIYGDLRIDYEANLNQDSLNVFNVIFKEYDGKFYKISNKYSNNIGVNRCPDNIKVFDNQFHGTVRKYQDRDSHYYFEVVLWVDLSATQKNLINSLNYSADGVSHLSQVKKSIGEKMVIKRVLEGTRFIVFPEYKCQLNDLNSGAVIYFRDLKQIN